MIFSVKEWPTAQELLKDRALQMSVWPRVDSAGGEQWLTAENCAVALEDMREFTEQ